MSARVISVTSATIQTRPVRFRLPFHFGNTIVTGTDQAFVEISARVDGQPVKGNAAQLMVPRWFDKRASRTNDETVADLRHSCELACNNAAGEEGLVSEMTTRLRQKSENATAETMPRLAAHFGPALVEMALIDALCFAEGVNFAQAVQQDLFGVSAMAAADISRGAVVDALAGVVPLKTIAPRQTVGFSAPVFDSECAKSADGDPVSLQTVIRQTGIHAFKIKLNGEPDADSERLCHIAQLVDGMDGLRITLDANEQYTPERFSDFLDALERNTRLERFKRAIAFIEQPFARETALTQPLAPELKRFPLIIDESDDHDDVFAFAIENGWSGTSIKSCKGVLRAQLNHARARVKGGGLFISAEDLTCQPGICWQQDTLMAATLGCADIERNGHYFGGGLQGYPEGEVARLLAHHPDLYRQSGGRVTLAIEEGEISIGSLFSTGFAR